MTEDFTDPPSPTAYLEHQSDVGFEPTFRRHLLYELALIREALRAQTDLMIAQSYEIEGEVQN